MSTVKLVNYNYILFSKHQTIVLKYDLFQALIFYMTLNIKNSIYDNGS